jgi:hypothetical protein
VEVELVILEKEEKTNERIIVVEEGGWVGSGAANMII